MPGEGYILALDQGTTGSTALLFDEEGQVVSSAYREVHQFYPQPGWVEQDPQELLRTSVAVVQEALQKVGVAVASLRGQRMTLFPFGIRVSFNVVRIQLNAKARPIREI